jgi:uncharacterized protein
MIRDDKQRVIGKLISINSEKFTVELLNQSINFTVNGFDDIYHYAQINGYVILPYLDYYIVAEIFGIREKDADTKWKGEKEQILSKSNSVKYIDVTPIGTIQDMYGRKKFRYGLSIFPTLYTDVLYIKKEELDIVFEVQNDQDNKKIEIDSVQGTRMHLLEIGNSTIFPDYKVKIDINGFFGHHAAILGNTGSGKSCTISSMIQTLCKKDNFSAVGATFVFFDVNGEYHRAFSQIDNSDIEVKYYSLNSEKSDKEFRKIYALKDGESTNGTTMDYNEFKLPHWFLNVDEWALLLHASEKTQLPILRNGLNLLRLFNEDAQLLKKVKNHILFLCISHILRDESSPAASKDRITAILSKFFTDDIHLDTCIHGTETIRTCMKIDYGEMKKIDRIYKYLDSVVDGVKRFKLDDFSIPTHSNPDYRCSFEEVEAALDLAILFEESHGNKQIRDYCSSLITRFKSLKERSEYNFLKNTVLDLEKQAFIDQILGLEAGRKKTQITIIDLNAVDDEIVEVISCVLTRCIFETLKERNPRNEFPINLVLEEAHRYISEKKGQSFGDANKIFERVAKEGRKYGIFLMVSSQRPSELSKTVLSQCSNFIVHRIQNPEDLAQIRQMTPHISSSILSMLPSIPRQHALVFGHSVQIPTLFKVNEASPTPHSSDNDVVKNWFKPKDNFVMSASADGEVRISPEATS